MSTSQERLELGRAAEALLKSDMFSKIITHLTRECVDKLLTEQVGSLTANSTHATLLALNQIKGSLTVLASEVAVQTRNQK